MSVRKHHWKTRKGEPREAWLVNYTDAEGTRRAKFFQRKKDADAYHASVKVDVAAGVHVAPARSISLKQAAEDWLRYVKLEGRERATLEGYRMLVDKHILPRLGRVKLSSLTHPAVEKFRDDMLGGEHAVISRSLARKVLVALSAVLKDAKRRGNCATNPAADVRVGASARGKRTLQIPSPDEIRRVIEAAPDGLSRTFVLTAAFTGLRASELRGLRWQDIDLKGAQLHVRQRADRYGKIGPPKTAAGNRTVPLG